MAELAAVVPVVPVLAKADTMTAEELKVGRSKGLGGCRGESRAAVWFGCDVTTSQISCCPLQPCCLPGTPLSAADGLQVIGCVLVMI